MRVLWSLLRDKLNDKKIPPYPPKREANKGTGGSSARRRHPVPKKNTGRRKRGGENKQEVADRRATGGSSERNHPRISKKSIIEKQPSSEKRALKGVVRAMGGFSSREVLNKLLPRTPRDGGRSCLLLPLLWEFWGVAC